MNVFLRTSHCRRADGSRLASSLSPSLLRRPQVPRTVRLIRSLTQEYRQLSSASSVLRNTGRIPQVPYGFRELGIRDAIAKAMEKAFPDVQRPTIAQADFIPAILNGKDVLLHDETGTGKSFGSIVALLNKSRVRALHVRGRQNELGITSLVIVPHRDLGYQMIQWIETILKHSGANQPPLDSMAQLVARGHTASMEEQIHKLRTNPPHILIGTPQALWEIYNSDPDHRRVLQLESVATVVVDEVDYLLDIPPPYVRKSRENTVWRNFRKHPSLTRQILEMLLPGRKPGAVPLAEINYDDDGDGDGDGGRNKNFRKTKMDDSLRSGRPVQVVMSSATVHSTLTDYLCDANWLGRDRVILSGKQLLKANAHMLRGEKVQKDGIVHHAFMVSIDGGLANVDFAVRPGEEPESKVEDEHKDEDSDASARHKERMRKIQDQGVPPQSPTSPVVMEAVASIFALDVPHLALLVLPPGSSVQKAILELQDLGIDARALDLRAWNKDTVDQASEDPVLLVATPATIRGVDLPQLTHVFCAGAPDTTSADVFKHVAGRVGRFGREGKVMTFVTEREVEHREGVLRTTKHPAGLLKAFYRNLRIQPVYFDLSAVGLGE